MAKADVSRPAVKNGATKTPDTPAKAKPKAARGVNIVVSMDVDDLFEGVNDLTPEEFLESQKAILATERATYVNTALMLRAEADQLAADMEPGEVQFDDESGEGATMNVEREFDLAMSAQATAAVEEIDRAIGRLTKGKYGLCEGCAKPIPRDRLRALPHATLCISCKNGGLSRR